MGMTQIKFRLSSLTVIQLKLPRLAQTAKSNSMSRNFFRHHDIDNTEYTVSYIKDLAYQLAELAHSVGCTRLFMILRCAALEAELYRYSSWDTGKCPNKPSCIE